ncbi:Lamin-B receptor [Nymphon striatum]|nr:Lamin-B receptor [Nymphon striatum]
MAKWPGSTHYYDAQVLKVTDDLVTVIFGEGTKEVIPFKFVYLQKSKNLVPLLDLNLRLGDFERVPVVTGTRSKSPSRRLRSRSGTRLSAKEKSPTRTTRLSAEEKRNGFLITVIAVLAIGALNYFGILSPKFVVINFTRFMVFSVAFVLYIKSYWADESELNPDGNTGCPLTYYFYGREYTPRFISELYDLKVVALRIACITWIVMILQIALVELYAAKEIKLINPSVVLLAMFQILCVGGMLYYEAMVTTMASSKECL